MKDNGYKPQTDVIKKRFIGYKLGRISKKESELMSKERHELFAYIKKIDGNIQNTEKLLESYMPNVNRMMKEKQERKAVKAKKYTENVELSEFWQELRIKALERHEKDCPICYHRLAIK